MKFEKLVFTLNYGTDVQVKEFNFEIVSVGRSAKCDLTIKVEDVSREHLVVFYKDEKVFIKDSGSANGTFKNGVKLTSNEDVEVVPKDKIQFGSTQVNLSILAVLLEEKKTELAVSDVKHNVIKNEDTETTMTSIPENTVKEVRERVRDIRKVEKIEVVKEVDVGLFPTPEERMGNVRRVEFSFESEVEELKDKIELEMARVLFESKEDAIKIRKKADDESDRVRKRAYDEVKEFLEDADEEKNILEKDILKLGSNKSNKEKILLEIDDNINLRTRELDLYEVHKKELEITVSELNNNKTNLNSSIEILKSKMKLLQHELDALNGRRDQELETMNTEMNLKMLNREVAIEEVSAKKVVIESEIDVLVFKKESLEGEIKRLHSKHENDLMKINKEEDRLRGDIDNLKTQDREFELAKGQCENDLKRITDERNAENEKNKVFIRVNKDLEQKIEDRKKDYQMIELELNHKKNEIETNIKQFEIEFNKNKTKFEIREAEMDAKILKMKIEYENMKKVS